MHLVHFSDIYKILRQLNGGERHVAVVEWLREEVAEGAALTTVPAIAKSHWITVAFFCAAILLAIGGVIVGAILIREDIVFRPDNQNNMPTRSKDQELLLNSCVFFGYQSAAIALSCIFLAAGIFAFTITVDLSPDTAPTNSQLHRFPFFGVSLGPFITYMSLFWCHTRKLLAAYRITDLKA
ncbi:hypothetical protein D9619_012429 [Psilocybe cf. subviscida]|uniref:Uncharacterized protein n=1 Tax=Psilocybe cf. subviscida TaxID=2480587 RepID=A0A8H5ARH3_9AGAR|nr:hypothetical protein D9619_012429 [Psilocybe cf. subviscida]